MSTTETPNTTTETDLLNQRIIKTIGFHSEPTMTDLAETITKARNAEHAMTAVQEHARREVVFGRWSLVAQIIENRGFAPIEALALVVAGTTREIIGRGADDGWSGHGNDLQRVKFEALRKWVQDSEFLLPVA